MDRFLLHEQSGDHSPEGRWILWQLVEPNLTTSKIRSNVGKLGVGKSKQKANQKQNESKTKAKQKQNESKITTK